MAKQQRIIWTGLPNGIVQDAGGNKLKVAVHIAPRLHGDAPTTLSDYPDFLQWASTVSGITFTVTFGAGAQSIQVPATVDPASPTPDEDIWNALFTAATPVTPFVFNDLNDRFIQSHQARHIHDFVKTAMQIVSALVPRGGTAPLPSAATLLRALNPTDPSFPPFWITPEQAVPSGAFDVPDENLSQVLQGWRHQYDGTPRAVPAGPLDVPGKLPTAVEIRRRFLQLRTFYDRGSVTKDQIPQTEPDFHALIGALAQYPEFLRRLGLVIDLLVPVSGQIPQGVNGSFLQVMPNWTTASAVPGPHIRPKTLYSLKTAAPNPSFTATPKGTTVANGMLNLGNDSVYGLTQVDVDGAGLKMINLINSLGRSNFYKHANTPTTSTLPALRSAGIALMHHGRASDLGFQFAASRDMNDLADPAGGGNPRDPTLYAEDIIRGYRIDIFDVAAGDWKSLLARDGIYQLPDAPAAKQQFTLSDEGHVSLGVTENPSDKDPNRDLYLHEQLFRWNGWSLGAPMPGKSIDDHGNAVTADNKPGANFNMRVDFKVTPRSLPKLRFGHQYRVRVRTVDLAGNSLPADSAVTDYQSPPAKDPPYEYHRFDPVASPTLLLRYDLTQPVGFGESIERMVIRSDSGVSSDQYPHYLDTVGYHGYHRTSQRHVAPPKTSAELAERHGMLDLPSNGFMDGNAYDQLVALDGMFAVTPSGETAAQDVDQLVLPYLPDVLARGVTFVGLPGSTAKVADQFPFSGKWPQMKPFRLQVVGLLDSAAQKPPQFDAAKNILTVYLRQAETADLSYSSYFNGPDLTLLGIWAWMVEQYGNLKIAVPQVIHDLAVAGLLWQLTPGRSLKLVHAVQRPLVVPQFPFLVATKRVVGQTDCELLNFTDAKHAVIGPVPVSGKSTSKVDVMADWQETIDDGVDPNGAHVVTAHAHVTEVQVADTDTEMNFGVIEPRRRHHFADTKYRRVTYAAVATTRFKDYLPFSDADIASGKTPITVTSTPVTVDVPNSARPDAPKVLYAVPAFKWDAPVKSDTTTVSGRHGGYLRVYMDRTWFSSGDGELLGVVVTALKNPAAAIADATSRSAVGRAAQRVGLAPRLADIPEEVKPFVTQWGRDPLHLSPTLVGAPSADAFPLAASNPGARMDGLKITELPNHTLAVAGHPVQFDTDRQLWFADIQMTWGDSYYPFVRLALARFQPNSIATTHLSRVVQMDYLQVAPDRTATIQRSIDPQDGRKVRVSLAGPSYSDSSPNGGPQVEVTAETRQPNLQGELGWVPVPGGHYRLTLQRGGVWSADIILPRPVGGTPYRLLMKEYEGFDSTDMDNSVQPARRLVYACAVEV